MFSDVSKLDPNHPADKAILELVQMGLVEVYFDKENSKLMLTLTEKGATLKDEMVDEGYVVKPAKELTQEDKDMIETFLQKTEKELDNIG